MEICLCLKVPFGCYAKDLRSNLTFTRDSVCVCGYVGVVEEVVERKRGGGGVSPVL